MKLQRIFFIALLLMFVQYLHAQDVNVLVQKVKAKIDLVNDYEATGRMKTNVTFLKVPEADVTIYFKKPNKIRIKNEKGIS
ncbi:MAG: LolA family protein, partial [Ferruginibacter sp.]